MYFADYGYCPFLGKTQRLNYLSKVTDDLTSGSSISSNLQTDLLPSHVCPVPKCAHVSRDSESFHAVPTVSRLLVGAVPPHRSQTKSLRLKGHILHFAQQQENASECVYV
jgi:hypothetical protein